MTEKKRIKSALSRILRDRVVFALLFGSILGEGFNGESDVDIAVLMRVPPEDLMARIDFQISLSEEVGRDVDVIYLNDADVIIAMQALANGELIVDNDHAAFVQLKARRISEYLDFKMSRRIVEDNLLRGGLHA